MRILHSQFDSLPLTSSTPINFDTKLYIASLAAALATEIGFDGSPPLTGVAVAAPAGGVPTAASGSEGSAMSSPYQPVAPLPIWDGEYFAAQFQLGIARVLCTCCGGATVAIVAPSNGATIVVAYDATQVAITLAVDVRRFSVPRDGSVCVYVNSTGGAFLQHDSLKADHCFHYRQVGTVYETTVTVALPLDRAAQHIALATALTSNIYSDRIHWSRTLALTLRRAGAAGAAACDGSGGNGGNGAATCDASAEGERAAPSGDSDGYGDDDDEDDEPIATRIGRAVVEVPLALFAREGRSYADGTDAATVAGVAQSICAQGGDQFGVLSHRCPWVAAGELLEALVREGHDDMASDALWGAAIAAAPNAASPNAAAAAEPARGAALRAWSAGEGSTLRFHTTVTFPRANPSHSYLTRSFFP